MRESERIDLGSVQVHKKVFAEIVASAMDEIDGVSVVPKSFGDMLMEAVGIKKFPGINIKVDEGEEVTLEILVLVRYGLNIHDAARQVQRVVRSAIDKTLDIKLKDINVNVQGIEKEVK